MSNPLYDLNTNIQNFGSCKKYIWTAKLIKTKCLMKPQKLLAIVGHVISWNIYIFLIFIFYLIDVTIYMFSRSCWQSRSNSTISSNYGDRKHKNWEFPRYCCQNKFKVDKCNHWKKMYFTNSNYFAIPDKSFTIPLILVSTVFILILLILVIFSNIQQHRYVYFIQLIFTVIHMLIYILFPDVLDNIVR